MRRLSLVLLMMLTARSRAQVLHEKVAVGTLRCVGGVCWTENRRSGAPTVAPAIGVAADPTVSKLPVAIVQDGVTLFAPADPPTVQPGEQVYGPEPERAVEVGGSGAGRLGDPPPERRDVVRADRETGPEPPGKRYYHELFNPATFPFKRMTALDEVHVQPCVPARPDCTDELLQVHDRSRHRMRVAGVEREPGYDAFWGSAMVDFEPGKWVPLPSVAPEQRVLSYAAEPRADVTFAHDMADNWFVSSTGGGRRRLTWLVDAPSTYFSGELPPGVRLADEPPELLRPVPPELRVHAQQVLDKAKIRIAPEATLEAVLFPLVEYFRSFEVGDPPSATGSTYVDLALAQKGSCRHRSYAFAVTAIALGIPTRYVENELHVFVEVYVPRMGWRRVNLGGATLEEEVLSGAGKTVHAPKGGDPFPQPAPFRKSATPPPRGLDATPARRGSETAVSEGGGPVRIDLDALVRADAGAETSRTGARARTSIVIELGDASAFRGDSVEVRGTVTAADGDAAGLTVQVYLDGPGGAVRVGETASDGSGRFHATLELPRDLALGDHRMVARTPGDDHRAPSTSRRR